MASAEDIYTVMRLLSDINGDHRHPLNNPHDAQHRQALRAYSELCDWLCDALSRHPGGMDYDLSAQPSRLIESRPGFKPP